MTGGPDDLSFTSPSSPDLVPAAGVEDLALPSVAPEVGAAAGPPSGRVGRPSRRPLGPRARRRVRIAVVVGVAVVLVAAGVTLGVLQWRDAAWEPVTADVDEPTEVNAVQLVLGSCLDELPADGPVGRVRVVPCDEPHRAQVVGRTDAARTAVWTGAPDAVRRASLACGPDLLGPAGRESADTLRFVVWTPSKESWEAGDRTGLCLAASDDDRSGSILDR
ncbi:septum formation family protein [Isoptericola sp. NEAU-Y5]|uniref:Septum formation family protein n=1 Tax=Isoptericola luteus TaxID=2879484 RepID=A0ABS7ZDX4_9MICO|nr:septum formation family protein [Isoptericola sp. NEAU-Y5]MCA5892024.1 septum formation family protein [Isoptericola sp. NEAU-Y5]